MTDAPPVVRPARLVLVFGTGTEVGKTWVGAAVLDVLRSRGLSVSARKPAQSFEQGDPHPTDAHVLGAATGEAPHTVCAAHRWYEVAMAPPMAADALGLEEITIEALLADMAPWPPGTDVGLVETAGGARSPLAHDGDGTTLQAHLVPDHVVLVTHAGLGAINGTLLTLPAIGPAIVFLNRYDPADDVHRRNRAWLDHLGITTVVSPAELADLVTR